MSVLYIFGLKVMYFLIAFASIFNSKAKFWIKGRKNLLIRLRSDIKNEDKIAWFHCASLGEFEQGRPVIEAFREKYTDYKILLTFYSPSGYETRKNYEKADYVYYLPIDTPKNAKQFLNIVNPEMVFFIKYEFWFNFLKEIHSRGIPLYLVSGIFRENQRFFKKRSGNYRKMLDFFTYFFVQNDYSKNLLNSININNVSVTGDTRFDRVMDIAKQAKDLELAEKFKSKNLTLIAGSTWKPDEEILVKYINESSNKIKLIIAPHEIHKENIIRLQSYFSDNFNVLKYSDANASNIEKADILIIDSIGLLSSLYKYGDIAYIGGGFGKGIHNTLEAATFSLPVIFGPNYLKFQEAVEQIKQGSAFSINTFLECKDILDKLIENPEKIKELGNSSANYVSANCGATSKIVNFISSHKE